MILLGPEGLLWKHRKLMPTMHERLFHGVGCGQDLVSPSPRKARVGGLICWENRMPLARYEFYRQGVQIWTAPTADDSDGWIATMSHIAIESGAFVVSAPQYIPRSAFPDDFPVPLPDNGQALGRGGAAIFEPLQGRAIAGPLYDQEGIVVADVDLGRIMTSKRWFDVVGHYSREDILYSPAPPTTLRKAQHLAAPIATRGGATRPFPTSEWRGFSVVRVPKAAGRTVAAGYFRKRDVRRSARIFPWVWQPGQYCRAVSAKETSRTVSPQTGHASPVLP